MKLETMKAVGALVWILAVCVAGIAGGVSSTSSWALLAGLAVLPPLAMMYWWTPPRQSLSESIQEARK